jgi:uncharacterized phage protein gp47/JayE
MALTLAQLTTPVTVDGWRTLILGSLQGLGIVTPGGTGGGSTPLGTGSVTLSGTPAAAFSKVILKFTTAGEQGTAVFQYSLDGGVTFTSGITVPAAPGGYVVPTTGVTATFNSGPTGAGTSFHVGDTFTFALTVSPLAVTSWQSGGAFRTLTEILAQALADLSSLLAGIAAGGLTTSSTSSWLDLLASNVYLLTRNAATYTKGVAQLVVAAGSGPYTVPAGGMWFADAAGHRFNNTSAVTLNAGPYTLTGIPVQAELTGSAYNVANGALTIIQAGTLPGVTVRNPDPGTGTWVTTSGADAESDAALVSRCQARWPALSQSAGTAAVYDLWAKSAEAAAGHGTTITRTLVQADAAIAGRVNVYLATASNIAGASAVTDANSYIQARIPLVSTAIVAAATASVMTIAGTVNFFSAKTTAAAVQAAVQTALQNYIAGVALGSDAAGTVKVYWSEIEAVCGTVAGVRDVVMTLNGGTADVALTTGQVATLTLGSITYTPVTA